MKTLEFDKCLQLFVTAGNFGVATIVLLACLVVNMPALYCVIVATGALNLLFASLYTRCTFAHTEFCVNFFVGMLRWLGVIAVLSLGAALAGDVEWLRSLLVLGLFYSHYQYLYVSAALIDFKLGAALMTML